MALYIGNTAVKKVYLGATEIKKIYRGETLLYSSAVAPPEYCDEALALFVRMDVQPSIALKVLINKTIVDLKAASLWSTCHDLLYFFNLHTEQASLLNWVNTSYNATKVGSPTFTPKIGINMPSDGNHLSSNYNPASNATNFLRDSGSMGFWLYDCAAANNSFACGSATNLRVMFRTADTLSYVNATSSMTTTPTLIGLTDVDHLVSRTASAISRAFRYGLFVNQSTAASGAIGSAIYYIGRGSGTLVGISTHRQHNLSRGMTDGEALTFHNILKYFNDNVGGTF